MAKLYFSYAAMNAGKSTILLQASHNYRERGMNTMLLTAKLDDRVAEGRIGSRIGLESAATVFDANSDMTGLVAAEHARGQLACVMVDEAQFLTDAQVWQLAAIADEMAIPVMCYGLRTDFQGICFRGARGSWRLPMCCVKSARSAIAGARRPWWCVRTATDR